MSPEPETFIAEFDDVSPWPASHSADSANHESRGANMEIDLEHEIKQRQTALQRVLATRNPDRLRQGIERYKQDLPQLLERHKGGHVVAYLGNDRIGIAPTHRELMEILKQRGLSDNCDVFIKNVMPIFENPEHFHSHRGI